jgi:UDP-2-acetamido-3-amino-2,3-dideoxy-glucuronate N-acetyltransferase
MSAFALHSTEPQVVATAVCGVRLYRLPLHKDHRGKLTVGEFGSFLPFVPLRYFLTYEVPGQHVRGEHAHLECVQFLTCVRGSCQVLVDDGFQREEFLLDDPRIGLLIPPMVWAAEFGHTPESSLMVFASHHYDPEDYIRDYAQFLHLKQCATPTTASPDNVCRTICSGRHGPPS